MVKRVMIDKNGSERRRPSAILIAGPTASGKSALAICLARRFGGIIVNADSMQVYRDLRIITARPTPADESAAPHVLYGTVDGATNHSVSLWLADVAKALDDAKRDGLLPILVGGTGLYFKALTQGLSDIPIVPAVIRAEMRAWAAGREPQDLHAELARRDPKTAARLQPTDPQRLLRALEVNAATGISLTEFQARRQTPLLDIAHCVATTIVPDRTQLMTRIEQRFDMMMADGAVDEVAILSARGLDPALPIMRAHGVPPLLHHIAGQCDLATAVVEGKAATRRYVKRQETFTRNQLPNFQAADPARAEADLTDRVGQFV